MNLAKKKCIPCEDKTMKPLSKKEVAPLLQEIKGWEINSKGTEITKTWKFADFVKAMAFVDEVADVAEGEGHHPDIHISYNVVTLTLSTHSIGGLSENDFIVAAKVDNLYRTLP